MFLAVLNRTMIQLLTCVVTNAVVAVGEDESVECSKGGLLRRAGISLFVGIRCDAGATDNSSVGRAGMGLEWKRFEIAPELGRRPPLLSPY
jgi:hypothetical protein